jgi:hypothetical protein
MGKREKLSNYEQRERRKRAAAVKPHERPLAGAKHWPNWSLAEAQRQGQRELFPGHRSENPEVVAAGNAVPSAEGGFGDEEASELSAGLWAEVLQDPAIIEKAASGGGGSPTASVITPTSGTARPET